MPAPVRRTILAAARFGEARCILMNWTSAISGSIRLKAAEIHRLPVEARGDAGGGIRAAFKLLQEKVRAN